MGLGWRPLVHDGRAGAIARWWLKEVWHGYRNTH
jgi:hypothetical protein